MTFEPIWGAIIAWYLFLAGLGGGAFLALGLQGLVLIVDKQHDVSRGDGKEEHQPQQEHEQH